MSNFWEDPFGEDTNKTKIVMPGLKIAPTSLEPILDRQRRLLPILQEWIDIANEAVNRIKSSAGGDLLVSSLQATLQTQIVSRVPSHPDVLDHRFLISFSATPIAFPANRKPLVSVFDHLLPSQKLVDFQAQQLDRQDAPPRKSILKAETEMGLIRGAALSGAQTLSPERIIVYPELLRVLTTLQFL